MCGWVGHHVCWFKSGEGVCRAAGGAEKGILWALVGLWCRMWTRTWYGRRCGCLCTQSRFGWRGVEVGIDVSLGQGGIGERRLGGHTADRALSRGLS